MQAAPAAENDQVCSYATAWGTGAKGHEVLQLFKHCYGGGGGGSWPRHPDLGKGGGGGGSGGRDVSKNNPGDVAQPTKDATINGDCGGNPVIRSNGNKVEPELDFAAQGELGLYLKRTYNHYWSAVGLFGNHWLSNFDYTLAPSSDASWLWAQRPDGRRIKFIRDATAARWNEDKPGPVAYIVRNGDGTYTLYTEDRDTERYDSNGYITELRNERGISWTFTYSGKYLQRVTHSSGRYVQFAWGGGQVTSVTDPEGNVYQYGYTANVFGTGRGRLTSTTLSAIAS
jgi:YD repeat-containing protein